jgi:hypothetical protein
MLANLFVGGVRMEHKRPSKEALSRAIDAIMPALIRIAKENKIKQQENDGTKKTE